MLAGRSMISMAAASAIVVISSYAELFRTFGLLDCFEGGIMALARRIGRNRARAPEPAPVWQRD